jgi:NNP family nitrate/nitrite transporter-like MFS transporter
MLSTVAFTVCFAVWTLFAIVGIKIKQELSLDDSQFGLLVATPVLTGALSRLFLGLLSDKFGGRRVFALLMLLTAGAVYAVSVASSFPLFLVAALGLGFSGGSFAVGVSYVSSWFDRARQGTALGIFGAGTIGTAVTTFGAPLLVNAIGWRETVQIYAAVLAASAVIFYLLTREDPASAARAASTIKPRKLADQLAPLARLQVWRFSLY